MTRECLIFGGMRKICLTDNAMNVDVVRKVREDLKEHMTGETNFDMLTDGKEKVLLFFLFDIERMDNDELPIDAKVTRFLTGEGTIKLAYPLVDTGRKDMFNEKYFKNNYIKNNNAYGGDELEITYLSVTSTRMAITLKFKV